MTKKKLFVDDIRDPPDDSWDVARSYRDAIKLLGFHEYEELALDHDLGPGPTGYDLICVLEEEKAFGNPIPTKITCHSSNPVGCDKIQRVIEILKD